MAAKFRRLEFEIFGRVQGVFFRKYTKEKATSLGLRGWCMNTQAGTVKGVLEGEPDNVEKMKSWLSTTGSPQSQIDKANFTNEKDIEEFSFQNFQIKE